MRRLLAAFLRCNQCLRMRHMPRHVPTPSAVGHSVASLFEAHRFLLPRINAHGQARAGSNVNHNHRSTVAAVAHITTTGGAQDMRY